MTGQKQKHDDIKRMYESIQLYVDENWYAANDQWKYEPMLKLNGRIIRRDGHEYDDLTVATKRSRALLDEWIAEYTDLLWPDLD